MSRKGFLGMSAEERDRAFLLRQVIKTWNKKFAVPPRDANDAHRPWMETEAVLDEALARHEERVLAKALTFCTGGTM